MRRLFGQVRPVWSGLNLVLGVRPVSLGSQVQDASSWTDLSILGHCVATRLLGKVPHGLVGTEYAICLFQLVHLWVTSGSTLQPLTREQVSALTPTEDPEEPLLPLKCSKYPIRTEEPLEHLYRAERRGSSGPISCVRT